MNIIIRNNSDKPIYEQIIHQILDLIISGVLEPEEALPSIRYLAKELRVSVITTKRAYEELETAGFIETVIGKGSFVSAQTLDTMKTVYLKQIQEHVKEIKRLAEVAKITRKEILSILEWEGGIDHEQ